MEEEMMNEECRQRRVIERSIGKEGPTSEQTLSGSRLVDATNMKRREAEWRLRLPSFTPTVLSSVPHSHCSTVIV
jgi:hypothetical protein